MSHYTAIPSQTRIIRELLWQDFRQIFVCAERNPHSDNGAIAEVVVVQ